MSRETLYKLKILLKTCIAPGHHLPNTVKPVYNDHSRDQVIVVSVDRCMVLVQRCFSTTEVNIEPAYSGLYKQVVFICEWSLRQVSLYLPTPPHLITPHHISPEIKLSADYHIGGGMVCQVCVSVCGCGGGGGGVRPRPI